MPFSVFGLALLGKRRRFWLILLLVLLCVALALTGCGGKNSSSNSTAMAAGSYSMSVTASYAGSSPVTHVLNLTLQVTQ